MAKKKCKKAGSAAQQNEAGDAGESRKKSIARLFTAMQEKGAVWYGREREGIALIEGFQSALLAVRDAQAAASDAADRDTADNRNGDVTLAGLAGNAAMDPWLAEDLYQQVQELASGFEELLEHMYALQEQAREIVLAAGDDEEQQVDATELRPVEYLEMMSQELATFEAEYQHIEALLQLISFETSTDELRTLVISWSTSPFLDPAQSRSFLQRHQVSQQLHA